MCMYGYIYIYIYMKYMYRCCGKCTNFSQSKYKNFFYFLRSKIFFGLRFLQINFFSDKKSTQQPKTRTIIQKTATAYSYHHVFTNAHPLMYTRTHAHAHKPRYDREGYMNFPSSFGRSTQFIAECAVTGKKEGKKSIKNFIFYWFFSEIHTFYV